jgi:hypothetical protein
MIEQYHFCTPLLRKDLAAYGAGAHENTNAQLFRGDVRNVAITHGAMLHTGLVQGCRDELISDSFEHAASPP